MKIKYLLAVKFEDENAVYEFESFDGRKAMIEFLEKNSIRYATSELEV